MSKHQIGYTIFSSITLIYVCGILLFNWHFAYYLILLLIWLLWVIYGSFTIQANYHLKAISAVKTKERVVAITFDDGPTDFTEKALELLEKSNQKATFFCIGKNIEQRPDIFKKIDEKGHSIGNHTYTHTTKMGFKSKQEIIEEIEKTNVIIKEHIKKQNLYFRPPFGVTNPSIMRALKTTNLKVIGWNIRSLDTKIKNPDLIYNRIIKKIKPGSIILLHDTSDKTILVLERLLKYLSENKYRSVTIDELLSLKS